MERRTCPEKHGLALHDEFLATLCFFSCSCFTNSGDGVGRS